MTTQNLYFGIQTGLQLLIAGGVVWGVCWLSGVLKRAIETQEKTIAAQSTRLQDLERSYKVMKEMFDTASDPAAFQREQAYKARVDRDATETLQQSIAKALEQSTKDKSENTVIMYLTGRLMGEMLPFVDLKRRQALIKASGLPSRIQESLLKDERTKPDSLVTDEQSLAQYQEDAPPPQNVPGGPP